jgi:hypothetical protein
VPKDTHQTTIDRAQLELPEQVTVAVAELAGPKGRHNPDRAAVRHGSEPGQVTLGGRRVRVRRPRVRTADGTRELPVPSYQAFAATDLLDQLAVERMLAKLSTRRYRVGLEPVGVDVERVAAGTSSRRSRVGSRPEPSTPWPRPTWKRWHVS